MKKLLVASTIVVIAALVGIISLFFYSPDNPVEQACEDVIESQTGVRIDLSPEANASFESSTLS
jgi:hypothetical protein